MHRNRDKNGGRATHRAEQGESEITLKTSARDKHKLLFYFFMFYGKVFRMGSVSHTALLFIANGFACAWKLSIFFRRRCRCCWFVRSLYWPKFLESVI